MEKENLLVVTCLEIDKEGKISNSEINYEVIGIFKNIEKVSEEINKRLLKKKETVARYYEKELATLQEEINQNISELANEKDPDAQEILRYTIETLTEKQKQYESSKVFDTFIANDNNGELSEITAKDDSLGWICAFDIQKQTICE